MIVFVGGVVAGMTGAFFSDTETSTGNTFAAGDIDLQIDNTSYYNGVATSTTTWLTPVDLTVEKFFDFYDLKPGDYGEDTISIHTGSNDAWLCAEVALTSDDDITCTDPENSDDPSCTESDSDIADGDLADAVNFLWWADDGDNVLEQGENVLPGGPLGAINVGSTTTVPLTDINQNIFGTLGQPFPGNATKYIGKAWCFGTIAQLSIPLSQSSLVGGRTTTTPAQSGDGDSINGEPEDGGFTCDGVAVNNAAQTDKLTANVAFRTVQARHNATFQCVTP
ncbi:MAG: hypothetical protein A3C06_04275 [Candidatus Taylorbacteria bacterium RIFCSPHIGHO2_02_FULL_46_13]|uniref:Uncharacterized protein n=1 Tax=Candidatus Taylorbacteria bacterium RIFCSPHIGHO2_02_FULL_46_13 TaxID=1802312 RepID=A0A1G2MVU1_9BACT|nr:MAG: hypothetical protein A3C06_04275 [Candidatus Taylorbacteria bacterium RIFCSPHIGHO2_02_FULL_46_13]